MTLFFGALSAEEMIAVAASWTEVTAVVEELKQPDWHQLLDIVTKWAYPGRIRPHLNTEQEAAMLSTTRRLAQDIIRLAPTKPGVMHRIGEIVRQVDLDLDVPTDDEFEAIFPSLQLDGREGMDLWPTRIASIVARWKGLRPDEVELDSPDLRRRPGTPGAAVGI